MKYRAKVHRSPATSADTSPAAAAMMVAGFARMTLAERAKVAADLNEMSTTLAIAGIRAQHGDLPDEDLRWHLASRRYGEALADEVYGPRSSP